jgi:hypothetical protein
MDQETEIYAAVRDKAVVKFKYEDGGDRTVEAHGLEIRSGGRHLLIGYQVEGHSRSGRFVGWRAFDVKRISGFRRTGETYKEARRAPTTKEAAQLVDKYAGEGIAEDEIIRRLAELGTPSAWTTEYLAQARGRIRPTPVDRSQAEPRAEAAAGPVCSFCERGGDEVGRMVSSKGVHICGDCVRLCQDILDEEIPNPGAR